MRGALALNELRELPLLSSHEDAHVFRERIGHALVKQRLLLRHDDLLVARGTHCEPRQHEARREHCQHENKRDFFHSWPSGEINHEEAKARRGTLSLRALSATITAMRQLWMLCHQRVCSLPAPASMRLRRNSGLAFCRAACAWRVRGNVRDPARDNHSDATTLDPLPSTCLLASCASFHAASAKFRFGVLPSSLRVAGSRKRPRPSARTSFTAWSFASSSPFI